MKRAALLTLIGTAGFRMLTDLHFSNKLIDVTYDALIEDLDKAYDRKVSKMASRVRFGTVSQHENKSIDEFIAELRHASMDCGFSDQLDNSLKDQFVICLRSDQIKEKLLEDEDKDLADILKRARALELVDREHSSSKTTSHPAAQQVRTSRPPQRQEAYEHPNARKNDASNQTMLAQVECNRCGKFGHQPERCFFLTLKLICNKCGRVGHKAKVCRSQFQRKPSESTSKSSSKDWRGNTLNNDRSKSRSQPRGLSSSHQVNDTELQDPDFSDVSDSSNHVEDSTSNSIMTVHSIENVPPLTYKVEINKLLIAMELDSGSCYSLLNSEHWKQLGKFELTK